MNDFFKKYFSREANFLNWLLLFLFLLTMIPLRDVSAKSSGDFNDEFDRIHDKLDSQWDKVGEEISEEIFEAITDQTLASKDIGAASLSVGISRETHDDFNFNTNSYTVIDKFSIPLQIPIYTTSIPVGITDLEIGLKTYLQLEAANIRTVSKKTNVNNLPKLNELDGKLKEFNKTFIKEVDLMKLDEAKKNNQPVDVEAENSAHEFIFIAKDKKKSFKDKAAEKVLPWNSNDPDTYAKYSNLWNMLSHPFRLPLTKDKVLKMKVGDMTSHSLAGGVELGLGFGIGKDFDFIGWDFVDEKLGAAVNTYLKGTFRIVVWKKDKDHVQLKFSRVVTEGGSVTLGSAHNNKEVLFEGFSILGADILEYKETIVPFSFKIDKKLAKTFDFGFTYDLRIKDAMNAYLDAVKGKFAKSVELSKESKNGVARNFLRGKEDHVTTTSHKIKFGLLFQKTAMAEKMDTQAVIKTPLLNDEGNMILDKKGAPIFDKKYMFYATNRNSTGYDSIVSLSESKRYVIKTTIDKNLHEASETQGAGMTIDVRIKDSMTSAAEMEDYISTIEYALQKDLFPKIPRVDVKCEDFKFPFFDYNNEQCKKIQTRMKQTVLTYGKSTFDYSFVFNKQQLEKFKHFPEDKMWEIVEQAYKPYPDGIWSNSLGRIVYGITTAPATLLNIPITILGGATIIEAGDKIYSAATFVSKWKDLKHLDYDNYSDYVEALSDMFSTFYFNDELLRVILAVMHESNEKFYYKVSANNKTLFKGLIADERGTKDEKLGDVEDHLAALMDFDTVEYKRKIANGAQVIDGFRAWVEGDKGKEELVLEIDAKNTPQFFFVRIDNISFWHSYNTLLSFVTFNRDDYIKGGKTKQIRIPKNAKEGFKGLIAEAFFRKETGENKKIMVAASKYGEIDKWGPVLSVELESPEK